MSQTPTHSTDDQFEPDDHQKPVTDFSETSFAKHPVSEHSSSKTFISGIVMGGVLVALAAVGVFAFFVQTKNTPETKPTSASPTIAIQATQSIPSAASAEQSVTQLGQQTITWLAQPKKIATPDVFVPYTDEFTFMTDEAECYQVATVSDESMLLSCYMKMNGPAFAAHLVRLLQSPSNEYSFLGNFETDDWSKTELTKQLLPKVKVVNMPIDELTPPESLSANGVPLKKGFYYGYFLSDQKDPQLVTTTSAGKLFSTYQPILDSQSVFARSLFLELKDHTIVPYSTKDAILTAERVAKVTWSNGQANTTEYTQSLLSGCSLTLVNSTAVIRKDSSLLAGKEKVGTVTAGGAEIFTFHDNTSELVKALYNNYKVGRDYPDTPKTLSLAEFAAAQTHFLWQDSLGDWQIFASTDFAPLAECGKPVIYLYPKQTTSVRVRVDAAITKSEPKYPDGGWQVLAYPSGKLEYQGQTYPNLFWEGLGNGFYPNYQDHGEVVTQEQLIPTVKEQLKLLGLNEKESSDFLEFWQPRFPQTPYTRLTWLGTSEMNALAPLTVSPQPDTMIRVFLEFEGLQQHKVLIPQRLSHQKRVGFTLVEWGGLLRK